MFQKMKPWIFGGITVVLMVIFCIAMIRTESREIRDGVVIDKHKGQDLYYVNKVPFFKDAYIVTLKGCRSETSSDCRTWDAKVQKDVWDHLSIGSHYHDGG